MVVVLSTPRAGSTWLSKVLRAHPGLDVHGQLTNDNHKLYLATPLRALNPFEGSFYREALQMSRLTREMFCLMEGRHVHPSTIYPGGVGTMPQPTLFTDYLSRLLSVLDFVNGSPLQPPQRSSSSRPARRAMRSSSLGNA